MYLPQFIVLLAFALCFSTAALSNSESEDSSTDIFDRKAVVAVKVKGNNGFCSGAVVAGNKVITATHCVYDLKRQRYFASEAIVVGIGENIFSADIRWLAISDIETGAMTAIQTVSDYLRNDLVVLNVAEPIPVKPLLIASTLNADSSLHAWGFGEDEWGYVGIRKSRLLKDPAFEQGLIVFSSGACQGDSGGPILDDKHQVVGIVSLSEVPHCVNQGRRIAQRVKAGQSHSF